MAKREDFVKISEIFSDYGDIKAHIKKTTSLRFPMYLTEEMEREDIEVLDLSPRASNSLRRYGINTIGALCEKLVLTGRLKDIRNCGTTSVREIMDSLFAYNYYRLSAERRKGFIENVIKMNSFYN